MYTKLKRMLEKEENRFLLIFAFMFAIVFLVGILKMGEYETQKSTIEYVKDGMWEDGVSYDEINQAIIELCKKSSNEVQCLRDFLK